MFSKFLLNPLRVGAICSTSQRFARQMVSWIEWERARSVIEYGPGTGAFTKQILPRLRDDSRFFAIELDKELFRDFSRRYPKVKIYNESAVDVGALCHRERIPEVDAIVSALPWACFSEEHQEALLEATLKVLKPGGQFATIAYKSGMLLNSGKNFAHKLQKYFSQVSSSRTVWSNVPPAFFYRCRR